MENQTDIYERLDKIELELLAVKKTIAKRINSDNSLHKDIHEIATRTNVAQYGCSIAIRAVLARLAKGYESDLAIYQFIQTLYQSL